MWMSFVRRAEKVVIVSHHFLVRADQHEREVIRLVRIEGVQLQHLFDVVQIHKLVDDTV